MADITVVFPEGPMTKTDVQAAGVMAEALQIIHDRNHKYRDLWMEGGVEDAVDHIKHKAKRVAMGPAFPDQLHPVDFVEDALDLINYAVFYVLNAREGRWNHDG